MQTTLFRIIKYPTITKTESKKRRKALDYAIANDTEAIKEIKEVFFIQGMMTERSDALTYSPVF